MRLCKNSWTQRRGPGWLGAALLPKCRLVSSPFPAHLGQGWAAQPTAVAGGGRRGPGPGFCVLQVLYCLWQGSGSVHPVIPARPWGLPSAFQLPCQRPLALPQATAWSLRRRPSSAGHCPGPGWGPKHGPLLLGPVDSWSVRLGGKSRERIRHLSDTAAAVQGCPGQDRLFGGRPRAA